MASFNEFQVFVENLSEGVHDLGADTLKLMFTNTLPVNTNTVISNITEIAAGNGYTAGGLTLTVTSSTQVAGIYRLVIADETITASGGTIGPFRYFVLYNSTPTAPNQPLIGWYDYGAENSLLDGDTFTLDFDGVNGAITLQRSP